MLDVCRAEPEDWCQDTQSSDYCEANKESFCAEGAWPSWVWCRKTCGNCYGNADEVQQTNDYMTEMCPEAASSSGSVTSAPATEPPVTEETTTVAATTVSIPGTGKGLVIFHSRFL